MNPYQRMIRYQKISDFLSEAEHVTKLVVTLGRSSLGLVVFIAAKQEQRNQDRAEAEAAKTQAFDVDGALIADFIRRINSSNQDVQDAEVVEPG